MDTKKTEEKDVLDIEILLEAKDARNLAIEAVGLEEIIDKTRVKFLLGKIKEEALKGEFSFEFPYELDNLEIELLEKLGYSLHPDKFGSATSRRTGYLIFWN